MTKVKFLAFGNFPRKKCDPNDFFDEYKISHSMRLEINTEGKTFSKVDFFGFLTISQAIVARP